MMIASGRQECLAANTWPEAGVGDSWALAGLGKRGLVAPRVDVMLARVKVDPSQLVDHRLVGAALHTDRAATRRARRTCGLLTTSRFIGALERQAHRNLPSSPSPADPTYMLAT